MAFVSGNKQNRWRVARDLSLVITAAGLWFWNSMGPWIVTAWPGLNGFLYIAATGVFPTLVIVHVFRFRTLWTTVLGWMLLVPLLFYFLLPFPLLLMAASDGGWVEEVVEVPAGWTMVRGYLLNGGATTDYGYEVRQELTVLPGIRLIRPITREYPCLDVKLRVASNVLQTEAKPSDHYCRDLKVSYPLKRYLYF